MTDAELRRLLDRVAGRPVTLIFCCPNGGYDTCPNEFGDAFSCRVFHRVDGRSPITYREALLIALRRRGVEP